MNETDRSRRLDEDAWCHSEIVISLNLSGLAGEIAALYLYILTIKEQLVSLDRSIRDDRESIITSVVCIVLKSTVEASNS